MDTIYKHWGAMKIKMLETRRFSEDGFCLKRLFRGETHDVGHTAACMIISRGWAEPLAGDKIA